MKPPRNRRDPGPTVFGWDEEPTDERPSEFAQTQQEPASGYYRGGSVHPVRTARRSSRLGWVAVFVFVLLLIVAVGAALRWLVPLLHR